MYLHPDHWSALQGYFFLELKFSEKNSAKSAVASRYRVLSTYFHNNNLPFNKQNFLAFILYMKDQGYSFSYINNFIKIAKHIDKYYKINELQDFTYFDEKKKNNYEILTTEEIYALAHIQLPYQKMADKINDRQRILLMLLGTTGCRISEALELKRSDIYHNPPHVVFRDTKNGTDRAVPIADFLYKDLLRLSEGSDLVFKSGRGGTLDPQQVNIDIKTRAKAINLDKPIWNHLFRHSFITTMLESGVDVSDVSVIVGHSDPKSTMRYKNSQLEHYSNIIMMNPLLKKSLTLDTIKSRVFNVVNRLVDRGLYSVTISEDSNEFIVKIKKT